MKAISVLGSTGSIGTQTLEIAEAFPERFRVVALTANRNLDLLLKCNFLRGDLFLPLPLFVSPPLLASSKLRGGRCCCSYILAMLVKHLFIAICDIVQSCVEQ